MRITIIYGIIVVSLFFLGMVLDITGLWLSVKLAEQKKVKKSKFFYKIMTIGEFIETIGKEGILLMPIVFTIEILKIT